MSWFNFLKKDKQPQRTWAVIDVNDKDFKKQVIRRSYKTPVMVDFWAAWCGPCRQLGPILEDLAADPQSDFVLAKLDTENNHRIARKFHIQSIPNVKMFRNGQVVGEFSGARPAVLVKRFLQKTVEQEPPAPRISGSSDPTQRLSQIKTHLTKGRGFEAFVLLSNFPAGEGEESAAGLLPLARFLFDMEDGDALTGIDEIDKPYDNAFRFLNKRNYEQALEALFEARDLGEEADQQYTTAVIESIVSFLGKENPISENYSHKLENEEV